MRLSSVTIAREKGSLSAERSREIAKALLELPQTIRKVLDTDKQVADLAKIFTYAHNFIYLGRGYNYPTALEGA
ncbi:MAG: glutamine--fructose-6-phosphate aminotransferase, partial [Bacteroidales bacterium]|nr:glutamine--fructose-6-phosphate aminotransferase [Bacteroidales bacterium]